jgi:Transposase DDE domain
LPCLIAALLSMRGQSQQVTLDAFFGSLCDSPLPGRGVSDRAFAKARSQLHMPALTALNDMLVERADAEGLVPRWRGLRVVAGDGSVLMPAVRQCSRTQGLASADQRLFALFLPGAELTLHACVYDAQGSERQLLVESLDRLGPDDLLVLDRGYPASWLVCLLNERGVRWCMRCDNDSGWAPVRAFMRAGTDEASVTLSAPSAADAATWDCGRTAPTVRLVRQISPSGAIRVLVTNLDSHDYPCHAFADLYHQRWRIEEGFKRLKLRLHLESVSGLSQQAVIIDVAAKILADNLASLLCAAAADQADLPSRGRRCNRSYAASLFQRAIARLLLAVGDFLATVDEVLTLLGSTTHRFVAGRSSPRPSNHTKPHPNLAYKG